MNIEKLPDISEGTAKYLSTRLMVSEKGETIRDQTTETPNHSILCDEIVREEMSIVRDTNSGLLLTLEKGLERMYHYQTVDYRKFHLYGLFLVFAAYDYELQDDFVESIRSFQPLETVSIFDLYQSSGSSQNAFKTVDYFDEMLYYPTIPNADANLKQFINKVGPKVTLGVHTDKFRIGAGFGRKILELIFAKPSFLRDNPIYAYEKIVLEELDQDNIIADNLEKQSPSTGIDSSIS